MRKLFEILLLAIFIGATIVASKWIGQQAFTWMPTQATAEAQQVDNLFSFLVSVGAFIFIGLSGTIAFSILTSRAPRGDWSDGHPMRQDARLEVLWTVVPLIFVLWIAGQSFKIYQQLNIQGLTPIVHLHLPLEAEPAYAADSPPKPAESSTTSSPSKPAENNNAKPTTQQIEVIAKQWAWLFRYPDNVTSTDLHLPVNQSIQLVLRSEDVLHGFYVPEFRVKQDIIPNRNITFVVTPLKEGKYQLKDSQYSGVYFALMRANVYVESPEAYQMWLSQAAQHQPLLSHNAAFAEYTQQRQNAEGSKWAVMPPAPPVPVNDPGKDGS